jgi:hypothetical protein
LELNGNVNAGVAEAVNVPRLTSVAVFPSATVLLTPVNESVSMPAPEPSVSVFVPAPEHSGIPPQLKTPFVATADLKTRLPSGRMLNGSARAEPAERKTQNQQERKTAFFMALTS